MMKRTPCIAVLLLASCTTSHDVPCDNETPQASELRILDAGTDASWACEDDGGPWYVRGDGGVYPVWCGDGSAGHD